MTNLTLVLALCSWLCGTTSAHAASRNNEAIYAKGQAKLVEVMKIGGGPDEGDGDPVFFRPIDLCVAPDGTIYVLDHEVGEVLAFDRLGEFRFKFGRPGEGPGELRDAWFISTDRFRRVVVYEGGNRRFSVFSPSGKFISAARCEDIAGFECLPDGRILAARETAVFAGTESDSHISLAMLDSTFAVTAVLDSLVTRKFVSIRTEQGVAMTSQPFFLNLLWSRSPDGTIYTAHSDEYRIRVFGGNLKLQRTITRDVPPVDVTTEDRAEHLEGMSEPVAAQMKFPRHQPPLDGLYCDADGFLLVGRAQPSGDPPLLDAYHPGGKLLGEVRIPGYRRNATFDGGSILMRVISDEELPAVIRYRLE